MQDEEAGATEAFEDAALYDWEYRRRRADVRFYRLIAEERRMDRGPGRVLDLACGTGRLLIPLIRDGHRVLGLDRSAAMLARAQARLARTGPVHRARGSLLRGDLRALPLRGGFHLAICAFHSVAHLIDDADLDAFFGGVFRALLPGGWLAFDLLPPDPHWVNRDPERRWGRTTFRHPATRQHFVYTNNHRHDPARRSLHIRLFYQPLDEAGRPAGDEIVRRLCHRLLSPEEVAQRLTRAGLEPLARWGGFDGRPLENQGDGQDDEHIYLARRPRDNSR